MQAIIANIQATLDEVAPMISKADRAYILVWGNDLGVSFHNGSPRACLPHRAYVVATLDTPEEAFAFVPNVHNGRGVRASLAMRRDVLAAYADELRGMIEYMQGKSA